MKAKESRLLDFLKGSNQFVIPIYQRPYRWEEAQCLKLWDDVLRAGRNAKGAAHFIGSVVYIQDGLYNVTDQPSLLVIDGQQRLTTCMLLIEALARAQGSTELTGDFAAKKLRHYYLKDSVQDGDRSYKMLLSETDRDTLKAVIDGAELPENHSIRIKENFEHFQKLLQGAKLGEVCQGLARILIVDISLERAHDNPQLIFESLNSTGKELGQADLIRNYVLMGLSQTSQTKLCKDHWRPMELAFGQEAYANSFDSFMRDYLTLKTGSIPKVQDVYDAFKIYARDEEAKGTDIPALVADIHRFARFYCRMALGKGEINKALAEAFQDIRELRAEVTFPFLMQLYADHDAGVLPKEDFLAALRMVEAYVFRRGVCAIPTNSHNKTFSTFSRSLRKDRYLDSIRATFLTLPSYRRFPDDREFRKELEMHDLYAFRNRSYWLRRLENHDRRERVAVEEYTIEHILPQNENLSEAWKTALGPTWQWVRDTYLHTLGNLTLTGYNPEMSDRPFIEKRDLKGGFKESPLKLNQGLGVLHNWDEEAIKKRAARLSEMAIDVWKAPALDEATLAEFKQKSLEPQTFTIADHAPLVNGPMKALFEAFRTQVTALNPAVSEEFLKLYVAYKTEENFVSVIPRSDKLKLMLNMPFPELQDARGICRDVTNIGHWSTGDVDLDFANLADLPYVMGLVRQAYEWRMDESGVG